MAAISKQKLEQIICERDKDDVAKLEAQINKSLEVGYDGGRFSYSTQFLAPYSLRVREEVLRRFKEAGWKVDTVYDQRDGDYLTFS